MHHEEFGLSFSSPLPLEEQTETNPVVLFLDPTPNRMVTAQALASAGWLPISANTTWAQCLELALATLLSSNTLPKAIIIEASHLLASPPHTHPSTTLTPARQYYELPSHQPLTAQQLAGYLAVQGFSPVEIPFILYTSEPLALLSTPTIINSQSNQEDTSSQDDETTSLYFTVSIERTPVSSDISHYSTTATTRTPTSFENNPAVTTQLEGEEDRLLAVLTYYTGIYLCRNCHQRILPLELAHLEASYQLWCQRCARELLSLKREETRLSPFQRRVNQLYREYFHSTQPVPHSSNPNNSPFHPFPSDPFPLIPPFYPARLLAKAAATLVTGTTSQNLARTHLEDPHNDPWNAA